MRRVAVAAGVAAGVAAALAVPAPASGHPQGTKPVALISGSGTTVSIAWVAAADDVRILADRLGLGPIRPEQYPSANAFRAYFDRRVRVTNGGEGCAQAIERVAPTGPGFAVQMTFACGSELRAVTVVITLLHDISTDYFTIGAAETPAGRVRGAFVAGRSRMSLSFAPGASPPASPSPAGEPEGRTGRILSALEGGPGSASLAVALGIAFLLGALHAITPGHGKTITAAYLVGTGGTTRQALALGGVVALTHAASLAVLGAVAVSVDRLFLPSEWEPWLEVAAGALIVGMGVALLRQRRAHAHDHGAPAMPAGRLAAIGLVGGLVPNPEAMGVVLVAFSLGRWTSGIALLVAFSLGLAAVVLAIAVAAVRGAGLVRRWAGGRFARLAPRIAAAIFLAMGVAVTVRGAIRA